MSLRHLSPQYFQTWATPQPWSNASQMTEYIALAEWRMFSNTVCLNLNLSYQLFLLLFPSWYDMPSCSVAMQIRCLVQTCCIRDEKCHDGPTIVCSALSTFGTGGILARIRTNSAHLTRRGLRKAQVKISAFFTLHLWLWRTEGKGEYSITHDASKLEGNHLHFSVKYET